MKPMYAKKRPTDTQNKTNKGDRLPVPRMIHTKETNMYTQETNM